jgi:hypothetical protein
MNKKRPRRRIASEKQNDVAPSHDRPMVNGLIVPARTGRQEEAINVRFGSEADVCSAAEHVRFTPNSDNESGLPQSSCLLYP